MTLAEGEQLDLFGRPPMAPASTPSPPWAPNLPPVPAGALPVRHTAPAPVEVPPQHRLRQITMLGSYADSRIATLVPDPPEYEGWREELGTPMPSMRGGVCSEKVRPCPRVTCRLHTLINVDETGAMTLNDGDQHRLGRPPSLTVLDSDEEAAAFIDRALALLPGMIPGVRDSCGDDVAKRTRKSGESLTEAETGAHLGVSHETVRLDMVSIGTKLRDLAAEGGFNLMDEHADPADAIAAIGAVLVAKERARAAPLVQIRRRS